MPDAFSRLSLNTMTTKNWTVRQAAEWAASAGLSAIVDNIPYVATMAPITSDLVQGMGGGSNHVMWWSLAIGADLGGNATAIGASANVVVLGIAERNRQPISFWGFTKYGLVVTAATVAVSVLYVWLRYFVLT